MGNDQTCSNCCKREDEDQIVDKDDKEETIPYGSCYVKQIGEDYNMDKKLCGEKLNGAEVKSQVININIHINKYILF